MGQRPDRPGASFRPGRRWRAVVAATTGALLVGPLASPRSPNAMAQGPADVIEAAIAAAMFPEWGFLVARVDDFADALAGSGLGNTGPTMFTGSDRLDPRVEEWIRGSYRQEREFSPHLPHLVYLLGGPKALAPAVEERLRVVVPQPSFVRRLSGSDRIETALAVADEVVDGWDREPCDPDRRPRMDGDLPAEPTCGWETWAWRDAEGNRREMVNPWYPPAEAAAVVDVAIARAAGTASDRTAGWADSMAIAPIARSRPMVVLLTGSDRLDDRVAAWLRANEHGSVVLLGGRAALSDRVAQDVAALGSAPVRISGPDRVETSVRLLAHFDGLHADLLPHVARERTVHLVDGHAPDGWAWALVEVNAMGGFGGVAENLVWYRSGAPPSDGHLRLVQACGGESAASAYDGATSFVGPAGPAGSRPPDLERHRGTYHDGCRERPDRLWYADWQYDACRRLPVVVNLAGAPHGALDALDDALRRLNAASAGLRLVRTGASDLRMEHDRDDRPIVELARRHPATSTDLPAILVNWPRSWQAEGVRGVVHFANFDVDAGEMTAMVGLRSSMTGPGDITMVAMHELGHALGLGHVPGTSNLMSRSRTTGTSIPGGDARGLAWVTGDLSRCR